MQKKLKFGAFGSSFFLKAATYFCFFFLLSCKEKALDKSSNKQYDWQLNLPSFSLIYPFYKNNQYFIFDFNRSTKELSLISVNEKTGKVLYNKPILNNCPEPDLNTDYFIKGGNVALVIDRYFLHINYETGDLLRIDTFKNYIDNFLEYDNILTGSGYTDGFKKYRYFKFVKNGSNYKDSLIYETEIDPKIKYGGKAPIFINGRWIIAGHDFNASNLATNNKLYSKGLDSIKTIFNYTNKVGKTISNSILTDENMIYIIYVDKIVCLEKKSNDLKWELNLTSSTFGDKIIVGDNIYANTNDGKFYIVNKYSGLYKTIDGPEGVSKVIKNGNNLYFVGRSIASFYKINTESNELVKIYNKANDIGGYAQIFAMSSKTKLLYDRAKKAWCCSLL